MGSNLGKPGLNVDFAFPGNFGKVTSKHQFLYL